MPTFLNLFRSHKNNNIAYYAKSLLRRLLPDFLYRIQLANKLKTANNYDIDYLRSRVNYYNKLSGSIPLTNEAIEIGKLALPKRKRVYYFDTVEFTRYFNKKLRANFLFGDITHVPDVPSITKSRPVHGDNRNSVILKLEKMRHFMFVKYDCPFDSKINKLMWRGVVRIAHRIRFMEMYFNHPLCNLGKINNDTGHPEWLTKKVSINAHLKYKFILCIEGYDVATNLKWVMSSNSVAVMPKPKYETWFMEGTLIPNFHYIQIKDDYSDLEDRLDYFIKNPDKTAQIARNANEFLKQFRNKKQEELLSLLVLEKFFTLTNQMEPISNLLKS